MRDIRGTYERLAANALLLDLVRGAICGVLAILLVAFDVPIWIALTLPFVLYAGLRWLSARRSVPEAYARCLDVQRQIHNGIKQIEDQQTREAFDRISCLGDKCLDAIAEDRKYEFAGPLLSLDSLTNKRLIDYLKLVRRGLDDAEIQELVRKNLATLQPEYELIWQQVNYDAVANMKELSDSIEKTKEQLKPLPENAGESAPPKAAEKGLTSREVEVLALVAVGRSDREIGECLFISTRTASDHVSNILRKLEVSTRAEAAAWAVRNGLV